MRRDLVISINVISAWSIQDLPMYSTREEFSLYFTLIVTTICKINVELY